MKFTLVKDIKGDTLMRPLLGGLLLFMLLFLSADILLKNDHIGLTPAHLSQTLFGNEEEYIEPATEHFMLELMHSDIFFMMMTLLTLSTVYARLCQNKTIRIVNINATMISALFTVLFLPLAYYFSARFVLPYIIAFYSWHILALFMVMASLYYLFIPQKSDL